VPTCTHEVDEQKAFGRQLDAGAEIDRQRESGERVGGREGGREIQNALGTDTAQCAHVVTSLLHGRSVPTKS
jgi:hypothetical protein